MTSKFTWTLQAYQDQGNLWLRWSTDAPFRAQQGQLIVYTGNDFPPNPQDEVKAWFWDTNSDTNTWNTGLTWGTNWYCAWIAEKPANGPYTYVVKVITDSTMGADIAKK